jgi:hypothetical protein
MSMAGSDVTVEFLKDIREELRGMRTGFGRHRETVRGE